MTLLLSAEKVYAQAAGEISPVLVALILAVLIILLLWLVLRLLRGSSRVSPSKTEALSEKQPGISAPVPAPVQADDLEIIEGIGPKIAGVLRAAGVTTFAQLAVMDPAEIANVIHAGGIKLVDTRSWPDQARLAAAGEMAGLKDLQDHLKAGHIVTR